MINKSIHAYMEKLRKFSVGSFVVLWVEYSIDVAPTSELAERVYCSPRKAYWIYVGNRATIYGIEEVFNMAGDFKSALTLLIDWALLRKLRKLGKLLYAWWISASNVHTHLKKLSWQSWNSGNYKEMFVAFPHENARLPTFN